MNFSKRRAFTIVELVIVIAVIAVLASVLIPVFGNIVTKAKRSSAMQTAKNTLEEYNAKYITETEGTHLPEGMVFKSEGYWFIYIDGGLHEIIADGDYNFGDFTASCWTASSSPDGGADVKAECDSVIDAKPSVTIDGDDYDCTDVGYLKTDDNEYIFAFSTVDAFAGNAGGCDIYAGRIIKSFDTNSEVSTDDASESSPSYDVQINASHCSAVGAAQCSPDADYILTIEADDNYTLTGITPEVTVNGIACEVFTWDGNALTIANDTVTGDMTITISAEAETHAYTTTVSGCTVNIASGTAQYGSDLVLVFTSNDGYTLDGSTLMVTIGGNVCADGTEYSWGSGNGSLTIYGSCITGDISVSLTAVNTGVLFIWNVNNGTIQDADGNPMTNIDKDGYPIDYYIDPDTDFIFRIVPDNPTADLNFEGTYLISQSVPYMQKDTHYKIEDKGNYYLVTVYKQYIIGELDIYAEF